MSSSIAVRQFVALARGEMERGGERNPFRVVCVAQQERYCLSCYGARTFDVIYGQGESLAFEKAAICRTCGKALAHPSLAKVNWEVRNER